MTPIYKGATLYTIKVAYIIRGDKVYDQRWLYIQGRQYKRLRTNLYSGATKYTIYDDYRRFRTTIYRGATIY